VTAAEDASEALRVARQALATAEAAAGAAGVEVMPRELTVERLRIVDPDGTLRMVVGNRHVGDEIPTRGGAVPHPGRGGQAGVVFVNDEGTECGGLIWSGTKDDAGAQLSFDSYEQDQAVTVLHADEGGVRRSVIEFIDRPEWSLVDVMLGAPETPGEGPVTRMRLAKESDGSVGLTLSDAEGRPRLRLGVAAGGEPSIELFDAEGTPLTGSRHGLA
jgi:hypothetical protein